MSNSIGGNRTRKKPRAAGPRSGGRNRRGQYRPNVGIVLLNAENKVFWARRVNHDGWQFPQGGVEPNESVEQAVFRELYEEVGLESEKVRLVGRTRNWLHYDLPRRYLRPRSNFRGQKQVWFLLQLIGDDEDVSLQRSGHPEFDKWRWVDYWEPIEWIVDFKRDVYRSALKELEPLLSSCQQSR